MTSPTQRTLAECKKRGWTAQVVEHWVAIPGHPAGGIRRDLFGFIDVLVITETGHLLGIQACAGASVAARRDKILASPLLARWLSSKRRSVEVWGWARRGARGARKIWTLRIVPVALPAPTDITAGPTAGPQGETDATVEGDVPQP